MAYYQNKRSGPRPAESPEDVFNYAIFLLSRRDYSEKEISEKMERKTDNEEWIELTVAKLKDIKYLDDEKFCASYIRNSVENKKHGKSRIVMELKRKGIDPNVIETYFDENEDEVDFHKSAKELLDSKMRSPIADQKERNKAQRFLASRGFNFDIINYAIKNHLKDDDEIDF